MFEHHSRFIVECNIDDNTEDDNILYPYQI